MLAWFNGYVIVEPNNNKKYRQRAKTYLQQSIKREFALSDMLNCDPNG